MLSIGMHRMTSTWIAAQPTTRRPPPALAPAASTDGMHARNVKAKLPADPAAAPHLTVAMTAAVAVIATPASLQRIDNPRDPNNPVMAKSATLYRACNDVRSGSKAPFIQRRAELRRDWPGFETTYDQYRRWRDCKTTDPNYTAIARAGQQAQREIMKRSGVAGCGEQKLFDLLKNKPELLKYISPINGDFRAPAAGVVAGLRFETVGAGNKQTTIPILAFPGTGSGSMIRGQLRTNIGQFLGMRRPPAAYLIAAELAREVSSQLQGKSDQIRPLGLVGHSLGGGIASFAAAVNDLDCHAFNPAALGGGSLRYLREQRKYNDTQPLEKQTIIRVKNDHVSSPATQRRLAAAISVLVNPLFQTPLHIGTVHVIAREALPEKYRGLIGLHEMRALADLYATVTDSATVAGAAATV